MIEIGIGHMEQAMYKHGFGQQEIDAMVRSMLTEDFTDVTFVPDIFTGTGKDFEKYRKERLNG